MSKGYCLCCRVVYSLSRVGVSDSNHPKWLKEVMERERKVSQEMEEA